MILILKVVKQSLTITLFVFVMMLILDYINVLSKGRIKGITKGRRWRQYLVSSFLGATPGCPGAFLIVSVRIDLSYFQLDVSERVILRHNPLKEMLNK